jgi:1-phosphofructokinase
MIYTCTFNPSIDHHVEVDEFLDGGLNRTKNESFQVGGKGINVSRMLSNLGSHSTVLGFVGGFTGEFIINELRKLGIKEEMIRVEGTTRVNTKIKSLVSETEVNSPGPKVSNQNYLELCNQVLALEETDLFVLAGNPSGDFDESAYSKLAMFCRDNNVPFIVDSNKKNLIATLKYNPLLVKPNIHELEELFDVKITSNDEVIKYGKKLLNLGSENVLVSLGKDGAMLLNDRGILTANAPVGELKNSVGSGDSMVGGFIYAYSLGMSDEARLQFSVACGSASAFSEELASNEKVESLLDVIKVGKV